MYRKTIAVLTALLITAGASLPVCAESEPTAVYEENAGSFAVSEDAGEELEDNIQTEDDGADTMSVEEPAAEAMNADDAVLTDAEEEYLAGE